jgi:hypothetical protein
MQDITETIYNSLTSLSNTNELYEREKTELNMSLGIELLIVRYKRYYITPYFTI